MGTSTGIRGAKSPNRLRRVLVGCLALSLAVLLVRNGEAQRVAAEAAAEAARSPVVESGFTLVIVPDSQKYTWMRPEIYALQSGWIAANVGKYNIKHVLHVGDITEHNVKSEWEAARRAHSLYSGLVPAAYAAGNHDLGEGGTASSRHSLFTDYITMADYRKQAGFGGVYDKEPERTENSYHLFDAGNRGWLILSLEFAPRNDVVRWANEVAAQHPDRSVILLTHAYLASDGKRFHGHGQPHAPANFKGTANSPEGANDGEALWRKLVSKHANFAFVISGHVCVSAHLESKGDHGNTVHQLLVDYQDVDNGGNGWLRLLQFQADGSTFKVRDYSPLVSQVAERGTFKVDAPRARVASRPQAKTSM